MNVHFEPVIAVLRNMWSRRWYGVAAAWLVAAVAAAGLLKLHDRYEITSRVYVDTQTMLKPLMTGITVEPDVDQMVAMLARTLITRPKLELLIANTQLDQTLTTTAEREALLQDLTKNIKFASTNGKNLFDISIKDEDPQRGLRIVTELVDVFSRSGKVEKMHDNEESLEFIDEQIDIYEKKLEHAENLLKNFKLHNVGSIGGAGQDYFARMAATQQDLSQVRVELRAAEESRDSLRNNLATLEAQLKDSANAPTPDTPDLDARIETQRKQLDDLLRRYTDDHPDVLAAKRIIEQLETARQREIDDKRARRALEPPSAQVTNPASQQMHVKLAEADAAVASLRGRTAELNRRLDELKGSAQRVPQVEADLAKLNRDYDVIKQNYEQLVQRREKALISGDVDASARLADFRVIEPPRINPLPAFPSHLVMVPLALALSLAAGILTCYFLAEAMPLVHDTRTLSRIASRPVLGSVSLSVLETSMVQERRMNMLMGTSIALLVVAYSAWTAAVVLKTTSGL